MRKLIRYKSFYGLFRIFNSVYSSIIIITSLNKVKFKNIIILNLSYNKFTLTH